MKVLHLSLAMVWGGNEQQLADLYPALNDLGITQHILCFEGSPIQEYCLKNNMNAVTVGKRSSFSLALAARFSAITRDLEIDIIHLHTSNSVGVFMTAWYLKGLRTPAVFSKKGISDASSILSRWKYNQPGIKHTICVSDAVKKHFEQVLFPGNRHKVSVVYDGIALERLRFDSSDALRDELGIQTDTFVFGNIANHVPAKDLGTLLKALKILVKDNNVTGVHLIQIGRWTDLTTAFLQYVNEHGLGDYVSFLGFKEGASGYMKQFNSLVMSSVREGLPISIMEAYAAGTPVIATKAGGVPEAVEHGYSGYVCETGDAICLAKGMEELVKQPVKAETYAKRGKELLNERFTNTICASNTARVYKTILKG